MKILAPFSLQHPKFGFMQIVNPLEFNASLRVGIQEIQTTYPMDIGADPVRTKVGLPAYLFVKTSRSVGTAEIHEATAWVKHLLSFSVHAPQGVPANTGLEISYYLHNDPTPALVEIVDNISI